MTTELKPRGHRQQLRTTGFMWGRERVQLGLSIEELARLSGVAAGDISRFENGRMIPTTDQYDKVQAALRAVLAIC